MGFRDLFDIKEEEDMMKGNQDKELMTGKEFLDMINNPVEEDKSKISDGYHTFEELYNHRARLYMKLCEIISRLGGDVWYSRTHSDGSYYHDWFILGIYQKEGFQITYHMRDDCLCEVSKFAKLLPTAPKWDGHTPEDVLERIKRL